MFRVWALFLVACLAFACKAEPPPEPVSDGIIADGVVSHLGIEYAVAERWKLPELNESWEAAAGFTKFGPACPQKGQAVMTEDCLFLNVFAPEDAKNAPVLIWFHGGGFIAGQGGSGPKTFADDGVVVLTFNYRLGRLGFHDWLGWDENAPRNFGQADMVAALEWVQANIERFGGDPKDVTLMGHSAGGMGVQLILTDPRAEDKFSRAWAHAGYGAWPFPKALKIMPEVDARINYGGPGTDIPAADIVAQTPFYHLPYTDAPFLREQPAGLWDKGKAVDIPIVTGWNSYDGAGTLGGAGFSVEGFLKRIDSPEIRAAYADDFAVSDTQAAQRIFGDMRYGVSSLELAENAKKGWVFYYDARQGSAPGAYHGQQYDELFGGVSSDFRTALLSFIKTGNPGWDADGVGVFSPDLESEKQGLPGAKRAALTQALDAMK